MVDYMRLFDWLDGLAWFVGFIFCGLLVGVWIHSFVFTGLPSRVFGCLLG